LAVERLVILANMKKVKVKEFLSKELERAGIGKIDIQRTPLDTRVIIYAQRPGIVIGKKGITIKSMTEILKTEYGLDNPQIEVNDLSVPALSAPVMARSIASSLERGFHFRRAAYSALRDIMNAGAIGAQITLSGKVTGERSRMEKFVDGYIKHCGEPAERLVLKGFAEAAPKLGRIGVKVKILPPNAKMPDNITIRSES
jgi:small subunit ribosomal protein S3